MHLNFIFLIIFLIYYLLLKYDKRLFYGLRIKNVEGLLEISVLTNIFNKKMPWVQHAHVCTGVCSSFLHTDVVISKACSSA